MRCGPMCGSSSMPVKAFAAMTRSAACVEAPRFPTAITAHMKSVAGIDTQIHSRPIHTTSIHATHHLLLMSLFMPVEAIHRITALNRKAPAPTSAAHSGASALSASLHVAGEHGALTVIERNSANKGDIQSGAEAFDMRSGTCKKGVMRRCRCSRASMESSYGGYNMNLFPPRRLNDVPHVAHSGRKSPI